MKQLRHTIFIYCEGKTDHLFTCYLKRLYLVRGSKQVDLKLGRGGDVYTFISHTARYVENRDYNEKYIILDADDRTPSKLKEIEHRSNKDKINLIWLKPCLEGLFLRILKDNHYLKENSQKCKYTFYQSRKVSTLTEDLLKELFPKTLLDKRRNKIEELDQLIKLMEPK